MRVSDIEKRLGQRPFVPFQFCMSDGTRYKVQHPELVLLTRTMLAVALNGRRKGPPDDLVLCDPVHIIRIKPVGEGRKTAKGGRLHK